MATISTPQYLLDQARRRFTPTMNTIPGMGVLDKRLRERDWPQFVMADPPAGSGLKPVMGDSGLPVVGHLIETFRNGPEFLLEVYRKHGPLHYAKTPALDAVAALGPDATQAVFSNKNKDYCQKGWNPVIGPFFNRGLMLLDFDEHMYHRRIMQEAFTRSRLSGYVEHIDGCLERRRQRLGHQRRALPVPPGHQRTDAGHRLGGVHGPRARHRPRTGDPDQPGVHHHDSIRRRDHPHRGTAVQVVARTAGAQGTRGLLHRAGQGAPRLQRHRHADGAVPHHRRGRQQLHRRRRRQPHDLPDDGRPRHLDLDADHDGQSACGQTGLAGTLPRGVGAGWATGRWTSTRWRSSRRSTW